MPIVVNPSMTQTESLWRDFAARLEGYLRARISHPQDAADLLQETFLRVHRKPPPPGVAPAAWLFTIVKNLITDYYRARGPQPTALEGEPPDHERFEVRESEQEVAGWLHDMAVELPPKYAEALIAADFEGASMKVVAERLGLSVSGAKSRVQRARKLVYQNLMDCCAFYFDEHGRVAEWHPHQVPDTVCAEGECGVDSSSPNVKD